MPEKEALKLYLAGLLPEALFDDAPEWLTINVIPAEWPRLSSLLHDDAGLQFNYLFCMTCVDWKTHLSMHYHLRSLEHRHSIVIKINLDRDRPEIATVSQFWRTADFNEREAYEMFGVHFHGHPDLRLLILPDGWEERSPMRKDFEDPVNMIRL